MLPRGGEIMFIPFNVLRGRMLKRKRMRLPNGDRRFHASLVKNAFGTAAFPADHACISGSTY